MFGIHTSRSNYWAHSKPVKWVRNKVGLGYLNCGTSEEWAAYEKKCKIEHSIWDWLTDDFIDKIQDVVCFPKDLLDAMWYALNARFWDKYWMAGSDLNKWKYHEINTRMLHCNFELLVNFIEYEKASLSYWCGNKKKRPWYLDTKPFKYWFDRRDPAAGLAYLEWEMSLTKDDDWYGGCEEHIAEAKEKGEYGKLTPQAEAAKTSYELYHWWKERVNRPDPYEFTGLNEWYANRPEGESIWDRLGNIEADVHRMHQEIDRLEQAYQKEDDEQLRRLIELRHNLWT